MLAFFANAYRLFALPLPVGDFWKIETVLVDVLLMLNEFVAHLLIEVSATVAKIWQLKEHRLNEVEAIDFILDADVEWSGDGSFFVVAMDVDVVVVTAICQLMDEGWVAVKVEDDWLVFGEEHIELFIAKTVLME